MKDSIKIQLKLDDQVHELTAEQAKELYVVLGDLLGVRAAEKNYLGQLAQLIETEKAKQQRPIFVPQPYPVPIYPATRPYWEITYVGDKLITICDSGGTEVNSSI